MQATSSNKLIYKIALTLLPGIGNINARKLLSLIGDPEAIFKEKRTTLSKIPKINEIALTSIAKGSEYFKRAEDEITFIEKHKIKPYFYSDEDFPYRLKQCADSPILLYTLGNADLDSKYILSVVGTRRATEYGTNMCKKLISGLTELGVLIVSGLAYGIDTAAHKNALDSGLPTLGVLAHGLDRIYPPVNTSLAQRMIENGGLITEFMSQTEPDRENFPKRNRIIAGLSDATIVIEAGSKGGALITADIANSYNRDVFAVPGRTNDSYSEGCNNLIKTNKAALIQKPEDIFYIMGWNRENKKKGPIQQKLFIQLEPEQEKLISILQKDGECSIDKLCNESDLTASKVAEGLLNLEMEGLIKSLPGRMYKLCM